jgi:outer membrane protein TolC
MKPLFAFLAVCGAALAQGPPGQPQNSPQQQVQPAQQPATTRPMPGQQPPQVLLPPTAAQGPSITLNLQQAMQRAAIYSQQVYTAQYAARIAREDVVQARAALLPQVSATAAYIYTQPNGMDTGVFIANNGVHEYIAQSNVHADVYSPVKWAERRRLMAVEAVVQAKADLAARGLFATVTQNYYGTVVAQRKIANAQASLTEAQQFFDITQKMEAGGEAAHVDTVKAQIQVQQRQRDLQDAQVNYDKARILFAVLLFPDYGQAYTLVDDLEAHPGLPPYPEILAMAGRNSPDMRVAQSTVEQQRHAVREARAGYLPAIGFDYFFGLDANQFAIHNEFGQNNLGSAWSLNLTVPVWTWGALRSKVRQAQLNLQQANQDLSFTRRNLLAELESFYVEAQTAAAQLASLKSTVDLSVENLRLTRLRYTAGEAIAQEVVDAQTQLVTARNAYDDGVVRYRLAIANLETLTGAF